MQGVRGWKAAPQQHRSTRCGGERGTASVPVPFTASFASLQVVAWAEVIPKCASGTTARREGLGRSVCEKSSAALGSAEQKTLRA